MTAPRPRPAATVVLLDPHEPPRVLLLRRHGRSAFMPDAYVFPGGRVDDEDGHGALLERLVGLDAEALAARMEGMESPASAAAHVVAAIRETFEESGALLARSTGDANRTQDPERLASWRARLNANEVTFRQVCEAEDLTLDGAALTYFAHWVTPVGERRRFDARFFVAACPDGQIINHDRQETTDSRWMDAHAAIAAYERGECRLAPPTWCILGDLRPLTEPAAVIAWADGQAQVECIAPAAVNADGAFALALPGDPLHPDRPGGAVRRVILRDQRWALLGPAAEPGT